MRIKGILRDCIHHILGKVMLPPGIHLGKNVFISSNAHLDWGHGRHIFIGNLATITDGVRIICHDASSNRRLEATWVAPVIICERAFIGMDSLILPGVRIGRDAIVAAGSVITHDVPDGMVVAGVPARIIGTVEDLDNQRRNELTKRPIFDLKIYGKARLPNDKEEELRNAIDQSGGYFLAPHKTIVAYRKKD